jgi:hypothetical protein
LGVFEITTFIRGLQCAWIGRAINNAHDNWSHRLMSLSEKPLLHITNNDIFSFGPVLGGIINSFLIFREKFWEYGNNWTQAAILNNKKFILKKGEQNIFDGVFFETYMPELDNNKKHVLNWNDLITEEYELLNRNDLNIKLGFNMNFRAYVRLKSGLVNARKNFFEVHMPVGISLEKYVSKVKKGSKMFRNILVHRELKGITTQIKTFAKIIEESVPLNCNALVYNMQWSNTYYSTEIRTFIFKLYNNTLGLNARTAHYNENVNAACMFCSKSFLLPAHRETFLHFFWYCNTTEGLRLRFGNFLGFAEITKEQFFYAIDGERRVKKVELFLFDIFKFTLWTFKLKKKLPNWSYFLSEFKLNVSMCTGSSNSLKQKLQNFFLRRDE